MMACGATLTLKRSLEFDPVHDSGSERLIKRRRCMPCTMSGAVAPTKQHQMNRSLFSPVSSKITSEQIAAHISAQIKWMQRRKQLNISASAEDISDECRVLPSASVSSASFLSSSASKDNVLHKDVPLLTQKQMGLVCERMIREREGQLKEEYDKVLSSKLSEQYDAFLMFNKDQFHRQLKEEAASYVS